MNSYDAVVVGGRVAGASTALLLARAGARVALVERSRRGTDTVSTHGLMRAGVLQLTRWGLLRDLVAAGTPAIRSVVFHYADDEQVRVAIRPSAGVDALYAPRRYLFDRMLVDAAAAAGADVRHDTVATSLLRDSAGRVAGVRVQGRNRAVEDLRAGFTIGADGMRSMVAEQAGARITTQGRTFGAVLYRYFEGLSAEGYEWAYGTGTAAGLLPTNDATCVFVATTPAGMRRLRRNGTEAAFGAVLAAAAPGFVDRIAHARPASSMRGWAGAAGYLRQAWGPGWALVGDAGYFKDPITTHGMSDALRDAELLAGAVLDVLSGAAEPTAFGDFQHTRDRLSADLFGVTEAVAGFDWDLARVRTLLREVSAAMGDEVEHLQALPVRSLGVAATSVRS
jgi:2-polyprenyl-6-methoxyphenol hydroxylase-like FAD-dependent oxidoreductase